MPIPDSTLKGILKMCKKINAQLGTAAGATLHADLAAATVNEEAVNAVIDLCRLSIGTPAGTSSIAEQTVLMEAVIE